MKNGDKYLGPIAQITRRGQIAIWGGQPRQNTTASRARDSCQVICFLKPAKSGEILRFENSVKKQSSRGMFAWFV